MRVSFENISKSARCWVYHFFCPIDTTKSYKLGLEITYLFFKVNFFSL